VNNPVILSISCVYLDYSTNKVQRVMDGGIHNFRYSCCHW
jgi:hypothetical protein